MKSSLYDSKKSSQKAAGGYTSSYADKYKKKNIKPSFQLDSLRASFHKYDQSLNQSQATINALNRSFQSSLASNSLTEKQQKTSFKAQQNEWIGQAIETSNKAKLRQTTQDKEADSPTSINHFPSSQSLPKKPSNILIEEQIQQDLSIYQQYRMLEEQYQQELDKIREETEKIQHQCSLERKRIAESQQMLFYKKKKLRELEESYERVLVRNQAEKKEEEELIKMYEDKLENLKTEHEQMKQNHTEEIHKLESQLNSTELENQRLHKQLAELEAQLESYNQSQAQEVKNLQELGDQQKSLLQEIASLQQQEENLQKELAEIESSKDGQPMSLDVHKKYLEIYEKMFITNQLHKAEEILRMKDQQRHQIEEIQRRKSMIKDKKVQISLKEKRIAEKNKMIDKLTQEIREKSTTLLNLYQEQ